jgi:hypothetical protein
MKPYNWCNINGIKIFDRNNPNFEVKNSNEEIESLFHAHHSIPILAKGTNEVIGIVKDTEFWTDSGNLIGDVLIWDMDKYRSYIFSNYEIIIDKDFNITEICCIEFANKEQVINGSAQISY